MPASQSPRVSASTIGKTKSPCACEMAIGRVPRAARTSDRRTGNNTPLAVTDGTGYRRARDLRRNRRRCPREQEGQGECRERDGSRAGFVDPMRKCMTVRFGVPIFMRCKRFHARSERNPITGLVPQSIGNRSRSGPWTATRPGAWNRFRSHARRLALHANVNVLSNPSTLMVGPRSTPGTR